MPKSQVGSEVKVEQEEFLQALNLECIHIWLNRNLQSIQNTHLWSTLPKRLPGGVLETKYFYMTFIVMTIT